MEDRRPACPGLSWDRRPACPGLSWDRRPACPASRARQDTRSRPARSPCPITGRSPWASREFCSARDVNVHAEDTSLRWRLRVWRHPRAVARVLERTVGQAGTGGTPVLRWSTRHAEQDWQDARSERPATGYGEPEAGATQRSSRPARRYGATPSRLGRNDAPTPRGAFPRRGGSLRRRPRWHLRARSGIWSPPIRRPPSAPRSPSNGCGGRSSCRSP